jgi:hypothetical protein
MTAKEKLKAAVDRLSEAEAEAALQAIEQADPVVRRLDSIPLEDEEISPEEEAAVQEARDELAAGGEAISLDDVETELATYLDAEARLPPGERDAREDGWAAANAREAIREEQW